MSPAILRGKSANRDTFSSTRTPSKWYGAPSRAAVAMESHVQKPEPSSSSSLSGALSNRQRRDERAIRGGEAWATAVRNDVQKDGRKAAGGWPGTLSEAKAEMAISLGTRPALGEEETSRLVRVFYEAARDRWLRHREREVRDE